MVKEDMRRGEITPTREAYGTSLKIALPAVAEMVSIALMGMIDMVMVGRIGPAAVASVALTAQPRMLFLSAFFAINIAATAIIARNKGAGDMDAARWCLRHTLVIGLFFGVLLTFVAIYFARPLMGLVGAQPDTIGPSSAYFSIIGMVLVPQVLTGTICAAQRACGNTKITFKVNVTAKIISVLLNFLLIEGRFGFPRLEVEGAAISTAIATVVAFFLALASVTRKDSLLKLSFSDNWRFDRAIMRSLGRLSSGGLMEQLGMRFGFLLYARVVAGLGTQEFAAHAITQQLMVLSFALADGLGAATTSLVGQNLGKKRPDLSIMYGKIGMRLALGTAICLATVCILFRFHFPLLFTDDEWIINTTATLILLLALIQPLQTSQLAMGGSLRGAGDTRYVAFTMMVSVGVMRPLLGFLFTYPFGWGLIGAWVAIVIDQSARLVMLFTRFVGGKWIKAKV